MWKRTLRLFKCKFKRWLCIECRWWIVPENLPNLLQSKGNNNRILVNLVQILILFQSNVNKTLNLMVMVCLLTVLLMICLTAVIIVDSFPKFFFRLRPEHCNRVNEVFFWISEYDQCVCYLHTHTTTTTLKTTTISLPPCRFLTTPALYIIPEPHPSSNRKPNQHAHALKVSLVATNDCIRTTWALYTLSTK